MLRRSRVQAIVLGLCALGMLLFTISRIFGSSDGIPSGTPPVVIVTVLDVDHYGATYLESVKQNRDDYAKKHGERDLDRRCLPTHADAILSRLRDLLPYDD